MRDVSATSEDGVTDDSLFLSVELNKANLMSPDWRYAINDIIDKQSQHVRARNDDDFQIYGNHHNSQQLFRYHPETGLIFSDRYPDMALNVVDEFMELVKKDSIPPSWKWKVKDIGSDSLFQLRHSNFEIEHILIDVIKSKSALPNINTQISNNVIHSDSITKTLNPTENIKPSISGENKNTFKIENQIDTKLNENNLVKKKKNTTIWILVSVIVILLAISIFVKIGCFPNYTIVGSSNQIDNIEEPIHENSNNQP